MSTPPAAHRLTDRRDAAARHVRLLRGEIDRSEDVVRLELAEAPAQSLALAVAAHLEQQHGPAVGEERARDPSGVERAVDAGSGPSRGP